MPPAPCSRRALTVFLLLHCLTAGLAAAPPAQSPQPAPPPVAARQPRECLTSPRQTLRTLYFAVIAYDYRPQLIDEAVACLDLDRARLTDPADAVRLAIDLDQILRTLCVPVHGLPLDPKTAVVPVVDRDGIKVSLARGPDGLWRFDRDTVERIPTMSRAALARSRDLQVDRGRLEDGFTDPAATVLRFLRNTFRRDFYSAAHCLDLSDLDHQQRCDQGPLLAWQLAFVIQRRGWPFLQEVPNHPSSPPFTWHADRSGRVVLERVRGPAGKDAWLFSTRTVRNIPAMYAQARDHSPDPRFVRLGAALAPAADIRDLSLSSRPARVPAALGSPRAVLQGFFLAMEAAETRDALLADALAFLDLEAIPEADRRARGTRIATKLDAVLRKVHIELSSLPDDWNAPMQVLGEGQGVRVEVVRQPDGCWRFSRDTVARAAAFFDVLTARDKGERDRADHLDCARDTMSTFLKWMRKGDLDQAADCLDLSRYRPGTRAEVGPVLAVKLRHVIDRIGRVYIQEVPDSPDGPRYVFYRGDLGRIVIARKTDGPRKGSWLFTQETVALIGRMFEVVIDTPPQPGVGEWRTPGFWQAPGLWIRVRVPETLRGTFWRLQMYQWLGLGAAVLLALLVPHLLLPPVRRLFGLVLRKSGSALTQPFVCARLRPVTWVAGWWLLFVMLGLLDLPVRIVDMLRPVKTFVMAGLLAWLGVQMVSLVMAVYTNSELLRPHRNLSDLVVPVTMRTLKGSIVLTAAVFLVYEFGEGEWLGRFLTAMGVAGLAASLAAQDAMKNFFSTLLLIGERTFKIGDRITVGGQEGVVEQVGFRATHLRTPDGSQLTVPNATLASAAIDNLSSRSFTRCRATLLLAADVGADRILALRAQLADWLRGQPGVQPETLQVRVTRLGDKGVEVGLDLCLTGMSDDDEQALREEINCELLRLSETARVCRAA